MPDRNWQQRWNALRFEAARAERQYHSSNRRTASLPANWIAVGKRASRSFSRSNRICSLSTNASTFAHIREREAIRSLSKNLPALWHASTTTPSDRQRIIRLLLERVVVNVQGSTDHADVTLYWAGGFTSQYELIRPVLRYDQMADYETWPGESRSCAGKDGRLPRSPNSLTKRDSDRRNEPRSSTVISSAGW